MFKRLIAVLLAGIAMVAFSVQPAAADKPYEEYWSLEYPVADCTPYGYDYWVWNSWEEWDTFHEKVDKDGNFSYFYTAKMNHTFTAVPGTSVSLSAKSHTIFIDADVTDDIVEFRGAFQRIIVPGVGPVFQDIGRKVFQFSWNEDGTLSFELVFNAGPSTYTSNDFSALCAALAP